MHKNCGGRTVARNPNAKRKTAPTSCSAPQTADKGMAGQAVADADADTSSQSSSTAAPTADGMSSGPSGGDVTCEGCWYGR